MQVSTRIFYPDVRSARSHAFASRPSWTGDPVLPVRGDERGGGYRGTLARGSHQPVNDRPALSGSGDKQVFVARSLSSTLAMLQMHVTASDETVPAPSAQDPLAVQTASFVSDLFAGVLTSSTDMEGSR